MNEALRRRSSEITEKSTACPVCGVVTGSAPYVFINEGVESLIYNCSACDFLFGRPVFISDRNLRQMDSLEDAELFSNDLLRTLHRRLIIDREIQKVNSVLGENRKSVLDIGCGTGWTSAIWAQQGFDVTGLEPSGTRGAIARERYGIPVIEGYLEDVQMDRTFDLVIMRHIVEHFEDPRALLAKASEFVAPQGALLLIVPNIKCLGRYLFDTDWTWVLPWHCNFFSPRAIKKIIEKSGLKEVCSWQAPSPMYYHESIKRKFENSLAVKLLNFLGPAGMLMFSPVSIVGLMFHLGDNISVIARKA